MCVLTKWLGCRCIFEGMLSFPNITYAVEFHTDTRQWIITPTKQNYEAMPEYLRPLEVQLTIPHPAWIDVIVW